ncbi:MAG: hypothetical protein GXP56_02195 [Deltaproteobacteria bacterium]|nr:hypothetical protein [Deltaproteobacteria bacterium]
MEDMAYAYFKKAAMMWLEKNEKTQNWLALEIGVEDGTVSRYLGESRNVPFNKQIKIANACGYDYLSFLQYGKDLLEGKSATPPNKLISINPAVKLLNECIQKAGVEINAKQKEAVTKIIRKKQEQIKEEINDVLVAFGR